MKKIHLILAALVLAAVTFTVVSCQKDTATNNSEKLVKNYELSDMDKAMIAFGERLKAAADAKEGDAMPLEEALTTLSNYQNFSMCNASHFSANMLIDTLQYTLNVTNGEASLFDLNKLYESSKADILERFNGLNSDQKAIYCIWTSAPKMMRSNFDDYTGTIEVEVVARLEESFIDPDALTEFDSTDYWKDFDFLGKCGIYTGQYVGRDCVTELNSKLHMRWPGITCLPGFTVYFTNLNNYVAYAHNYPDSSSPNGCYAWPWRLFWDDPVCVSPSEMTYYLYAIENDIADLESQYYNTLVDFQLNQHSYWRLPNQNKEAYLVYTIGEVNITPAPND